MINIARKEIKTLIFFTIYFIIGFLAEKAVPSGVCTPGAGFLLFLLSIPTSIVLALVLLFQILQIRKHTICKFILHYTRNLDNSFFINVFQQLKMSYSEIQLT